MSAEIQTQSWRHLIGRRARLAHELEIQDERVLLKPGSFWTIHDVRSQRVRAWSSDIGRVVTAPLAFFEIVPKPDEIRCYFDCGQLWAGIVNLGREALKRDEKWTERRTVTIMGVDVVVPEDGFVALNADPCPLGPDPEKEWCEGCESYICDRHLRRSAAGDPHKPEDHMA